MLWICGQLLDGGNAWTFMGVFDTEERAIAACVDVSHFIGPAELNKRQPDTAEPWPGAYIPRGTEPTITKEGNDDGDHHPEQTTGQAASD